MGKIHGTSALKDPRPDGIYTLEDYRSWPNTERWELIQGRAYAMSPSPRVKHQDISFHLAKNLADFIEDKPCRVFMAPLDVYLEGENQQVDTAASPESPEASVSSSVVQPDVFVVCNPDIIKDDGIHGAPAFIAEVLSDSTANKDLGEKKLLYERNGVKEYWVIQPDTATVFRWVLGDKAFLPVTEFQPGSEIESTVFSGFRWICPRG